MVGWVGEHGRRLLADDVTREPHYVNFYPDLIPTRSELSVPLRVGDRTVGVFDVQSPEAGAFDENDVKVMETLADQIAVAIANAQLYEEAQEARKVTGKLNSAHVTDPQP
jgi:GAF domain-containing protein